MNILINLQSFDDMDVYNEILSLSNKNNINNIYLSSSLMNDMDEDISLKYKSISKVILLKINTFETNNNFINKEFVLDKEFISTEQYMFSDILSSYRWLPISKRNENDFNTFAMVFYYDVYNFWNNFFLNVTIDYVIQLNEEHSSLDSILVRVSKKYNVENIITSRPVGAYTANSEEYHALYDNNKNEYIKININKSKINLDENSNFAIFSEEYKNTFKDKIYFLYNKLQKLFLNNNMLFSEKINKLTSVICNKINSNIKLYKQYLYIKNLSKYYNKISVKNINLEEKYLYFCMHFDPEAATLPKDNAYSNQLLNLRILASSLPSGWKVYVKEHPHQLAYKIYYGYLLNQLHSVDNFRSKKYYDYIKNINNVELVGFDNNHQDLIRNSKFVVSNTGTIFREASYMNKQCITFSDNSFYSLLDNVNNVSDIKSCKDVIEKYKDDNITDTNVDQVFNDYSVTITAITKISSVMLKTIINKMV